MSMVRDEHNLKLKVLKLKEWRKLMHRCATWELVYYLHASLKRKTCSLNIFELRNIHAMKYNHHKFQKKRIEGLIKLIAVNVFIRFLILLSMNLTCNSIQSLILLSKVL